MAVSPRPSGPLRVIQPPSGPQVTRAESRRLRREYVAAGGPPTGYRPTGPTALPLAFDDLSTDFGADVYHQMLKDADVNAAVSVLKTSILEDGLQLAPAVDDQTARGYKRAVMIRDLAVAMFERMAQPINTVLWNMLDALALGNKVAEQVFEWQPHDGQRLLMLTSIKPKPYTQVSFVVDPYMNLLGFLGAAPGEPHLSSGVVPSPDLSKILPPDKFCFLTNRPEDCDPRGTSVLRPAYDPWWKKRQLGPEYLRYLSQFAAPSLWATPPEYAEATPDADPFGADGSEDPDAEPVAATPQEELLAVLVEWRNSYAAVVPAGTQIHPIELTGDGQAFISALEMYSGQITKAILTQQLATGEGQHQARAAAGVHQDVLDTIVRQGKQSVLEMVSNQILIPWVGRNWGDAAAEELTPVPSLGTTEQQDFPAMWSSAAALMRANFFHSSQLVAVDQMLGLPVRDWSQKNLLQPAPSPAPGEPSAAPGGEMGSGGNDTGEPDPGAPFRPSSAWWSRPSAPSAARPTEGPAMTLLAELYAVPWAVRPEVLSAVVGYVERKAVTPEMLARACHFDPAVQEAAQAARWNRYAVHQQTSVLVDGSQALYRRGRTAILPITGPIVRRGNLMSSLSGGPMTSVELLAKDFTRALEDPSFDAILLDIDSPGGEASGIGELASIFAAARSDKQITAYVGDLGASAAYWLASSASEIVINRTAAVGSIGVVMAVNDPKADPEAPIEIVSSVSPNKRPDPTSKDGRAQLQALVDTYGEIFVEDVAAYRGVDPEHVLEEFGAGGLKIGAAAVEAGMADRLGSFESVLADLASRPADEPTLQIDVASETLPRQKGRPRSVPAPAADSSSTGAQPLEGVEMDLLDGLRHLVATAEAPASADREALIVAQLPTQDPALSVTAGTVSTGHLVTAGTTLPPPIVDAGDATLRARLVAAEAENARLKFAQIQARADAFARLQTDELRAFAPEVSHLVALYCVLAHDDETHGPIQLGQGASTTRVTYLENLMASRQSRKELTVDLMGDTVAHVLEQRTRPRTDPNAAASSAEIAAYLEQTATGRAALARIAGVSQ